MNFKVGLALTCLLAAGFAFAKPVSINFNIVNNTPQAWNPFLGYPQIDHPGPIVKGSGGSTSWTASIDDSDSPEFNIYYHSRGGLYTTCAVASAGALTLNPKNYLGDAITIIVSGDIDNDNGITCTCSGSACAVGQTASSVTK